MATNVLDAVMGGKGKISILSQLSGTADPGPTQDSSQGMVVGSVWFNATAGALRWWECYGNTQGSATWIYGGADYLNGGSNPNTEVTQFGNGSALIAAEGNVNRQIFATGTVCGGTGADYVLAVYALPANSFDATGRGITITAQGSLGSTANNKRVKIIFNPSTVTVGGTLGGGTTVADTGTVTTGGSGWSVQANVFKYGALGSNTQIGIHQQAQVGNLVTPLLVPTLITAVENAAITIAITGNATTLANDITLNFVEVNAMN